MSTTKFMLEEIIYQAAEANKINAGILMTAYGQMSDMGLLDTVADDNELQIALVRFALTGK